MINNLDTNGDSVICVHTNIAISNDKIELILIRIYEQARKDATKFNICKYFEVPFSISATLLITLLTSNFKELFKLSSEEVTNIAWVICVICFVSGVIMLSIYTKFSSITMQKERDEAIKKELDSIISTNRANNIGDIFSNTIFK